MDPFFFLVWFGLVCLIFQGGAGRNMRVRGRGVGRREGFIFGLLGEGFISTI